MEMLAIQRFFNSHDAFARHNGMALTELRKGFARAEMELQPYHLNGAQTVHGGALYTLADFAFAAASNASGQLALSINSSISFFKGAQTGTLIAEACELSTSEKLASYKVSISTASGELLATFQGMAYRKSATLDSMLKV